MSEVIVLNPVKVKNASGSLINPASDETLGVFKLLLNSIRNPPWLDKSANAIRNQVQSGTITTVSTVTVVTGVTNIDSYQGKLPVLHNNIAAWSLACRGRIS